MKMLRRACLPAFIVVAMLLTLVPVGAQDDAPSILVLPTNNANFLPGANFDFSVEVQGVDALPDDFSVTVNGTDAGELFGAEMTESTWMLGEETPVVGTFWRDLEAPAPGEYTIEVTAGGATESVMWTVREPADAGAQNVILFVADGGTVATYTAARLVSRGQDQGTYLGNLSFEEFEEIGLVQTSGLDSIMTDSANSASAYNTGHKSAVNGTGIYPNTSPDVYDDPFVETFAELVGTTRGMSVGVVTTAYYQDATSAAVWSHSRARSDSTRSNFSLQAIGMGASGERGWTDFVPTVLMGGGARYLLPQSTEGSRREDDLDVFSLYEDAGFTVVTNNTEMQALTGEEERVVGVYHSSNMDVWLDRNVYTANVENFPDQPGLSEMVLSSLDILDNNENGFYLAVEAASIDKALHPMDFERAIADTIEFDVTIANTMAYLEENGLAENTLVVVTSDHGHSFDVYGTVDTEVFNAGETDAERLSSIGIYANAGFPSYEDADGDFFPDSWDVPITLAWGKVDTPAFTEDFQVSETYRSPSLRDENGNTIDNPEDDPNGITRPSNLPPGATSSVHTLQDVPIYATGPGAEYFGQMMDNTDVFFGMAAAIGLDPSAEDGMASASADDLVSEYSLSNAGVANGFDMSGILLLIVGLGVGMVAQTAIRRRAEQS